MRAADHELLGVVSTDEARGEMFAARNGLSWSTTSLVEALERSADAVYISTRNELHCQQAITAAQAGRHILCEKPVALSLGDASRMIDETSTSGVVFAVNHHLRCAGTLRAIRSEIGAGAIGDIVSVRIDFSGKLPERLRSWRLDRSNSGSGVLLDLTVHAADLLRFITNDEVVEVSTHTNVVDGVDITAMSTARLRSGALATLHESFAVAGAETSVEVHGTVGSIYSRGVLSQDPVGDVVLRTEDGVRSPWIDRADLYGTAVSEFAAAVRGGGPPPATGRDGAAALGIALAATTSATTGRAVTPSMMEEAR
jgi:1,5-anhydro-D-fructose reductase (1,5-anhydro-D-mannitol-forming)